jgi:hypothetical protein
VHKEKTMKNLSAALLVLPLLIAAVPEANAGTVTRVVTTTSADQCRDFTRTTTYVNRTVSQTGTACLYSDGAWHDITSAGEPIIQYERQPVVVEQPAVYYSETQVVPVPVYYNRPRVVYRPIYPGYYDRFDHPHHYDRGYGRGDDFGWDVHGRF